MLKELWTIREAVRDRNPLVYNITNTVATNFTANVLLAAGASPIMSSGVAEADDLAKICDVLVINIGTLHTQQISMALKAGECAAAYEKPIVLDPVGVGATAYRNMTAKQILDDMPVRLIRGNYGEIAYLAGVSGQVKGVDSASGTLDLEMVKTLANERQLLVAATGKVDYVTDGTQVFANATGHIISQAVTASGCALSALTGAFLAVAENDQLGVLAALAFYGAAAQKAADASKGPGTFVPKFLDALYNLTYKEFKKLAADSVVRLEPPLTMTAAAAADTGEVEAPGAQDHEHEHDHDHEYTRVQDD